MHTAQNQRGIPSIMPAFVFDSRVELTYLNAKAQAAAGSNHFLLLGANSGDAKFA
jgi:hypothetical protein